MTLTDTAFVLTEAEVECPIQAVFNAPVAAHRKGDGFGITAIKATDEVA